MQNIDPLLNSNNEVTSVMLILSQFDGTKTVDFAFSYSRDTALTELFYYIDRITIYPTSISVTRFVSFVFSHTAFIILALLFPSCKAVYVVDKAQVCNTPATNADCHYMVIQCVSHNSLQEDVEKGGGEHTALSYSDGGSEPVPYAVVKVD